MTTVHAAPPYRSKRTVHPAPAYRAPVAMKQPQYRSIRFERYVTEYGYVEKTLVYFQAVQRRVSNPIEWILNGFSLWKTIETEEIPNFAVFQSACLGSTDWKSPLLAKFANELQCSAN